jgi:hypothetical protein
MGFEIANKMEKKLFRRNWLLSADVRRKKFTFDCHVNDNEEGGTRKETRELETCQISINNLS